jgi:hypothetical protein
MHFPPVASREETNGGGGKKREKQKGKAIETDLRKKERKSEG